MIRGVRGAIQVERNTEESILQSTEQLLRAVIEENGIDPDHVSAVFCTVSPDLDAAFPAGVRSRIGWNHVPFLCSQEIPVQGALERVVRILILFETQTTPENIRHQYLGAAAKLRPDLVK